MTLPVQLLDSGVALVTVATEQDPYLRPAVVGALQATVDRLNGDDDVRCVILRGVGKHFNAGAAREDLVGAESGDTVRRYVVEVPRLLLSLDVPVVAAMAGHAVGGGLLLGLWADIVVLAEESLYGANFMALGFTPGMGSTRLMATYFGEPLARELLYTGRMLKGREIKSAAVPVSHAVVRRSEVDDRALEIAEAIAESPRDVVSLLRRRLSGPRCDLLEAAVADETAMHAELFGQQQTRDRISDNYGGGQ